MKIYNRSTATYGGTTKTQRGKIHLPGIGLVTVLRNRCRETKLDDWRPWSEWYVDHEDLIRVVSDLLDEKRKHALDVRDHVAEPKTYPSTALSVERMVFWTETAAQYNAAVSALRALKRTI